MSFPHETAEGAAAYGSAVHDTVEDGVLKTSMWGLGGLAAVIIAWRLIVGMFAVAIGLLKFVVFVVLPLAFVGWIIWRVLRVERREAPTP